LIGLIAKCQTSLETSMEAPKASWQQTGTLSG
jgi:hypothetical protein